MKTLLILVLLCTLNACAGKVAGRDQCASLISSAWKELDFAKAEGFDGTVSYTTAMSLVTAAKTQQLMERFPSCIDKAKRARFYIAESRAGR